MRSGLVLACLVTGTALIGPAAAQSPFDGPLAAPDAPAAKPEVPAKHVKAKAKKPRHAASAKPTAASPYAAPVNDAARPSYGAPTAASAPVEAPADPLSLGMKWQGNNDSAAQTRSQNLDGSAFGSGAEVGMKLHF